MTAVWTRRRLLSVLGAGALAGCANAAPGGTDTPSRNEPQGSDEPGDRDLPSNCPTSQDLDVEWPRDLNASNVVSFVVAYENAYYRERVVEYEPKSSLDAYRLGAAVRDGPRPVDGGYELHLAGSGGVYQPRLHIGANRVEDPADADVVSAEELEYERLRTTAERAAEAGEATTRFEDRQQIDEFLEHLAASSADFDGLSGPGDGDSLYVDVNGTIVEVDVRADGLHGGSLVGCVVLRRRGRRPADGRAGAGPPIGQAAAVSRGRLRAPDRRATCGARPRRGGHTWASPGEPGQSTASALLATGFGTHPHIHP